MQYKLENLPGPPAAVWPRKMRYPLDSLQIGQSFLVPFAEYKTIREAAKYYNQTRNARLSVRKESGGYRCWRIA